ncbi:MAG: sodium-dependent transporter [Clostridiales bacterium]|nr:sodium-dependent transporter [Clostridiales bacterium]MCF8023648.1 sodium-dependent transporter [Clostridiales bacterium]
MAREQWGTRAGFILAAVGSAIGLGNIWRFPYMAAENGGGAFLIPYLFALLTAGIPIIIMEFAIGHKFSGAAPATFSRINKKWEWLGWWQTLVGFTISIYYIVIISWALNYLLKSFTLGWGEKPAQFFGSFIGSAGDGATVFSTVGLQWPIFFGVIIAWFINWLVLYSGVRKGIEVANKILMPILFVMIIIIVGRAVTLPGAVEGLQWLFQPNFSALSNYSTWVDAYGQVFFTLSIAFAIMITYSSYLPKKSDIANNGFMTAFINCGFSLLAGIAVFGILGYMASQQGAPVQDIAGSGGVGLAFITFPQAINLLPVAPLFGILFFLSLTFAGLSSEISINEAGISALMDKYGWSRQKVATGFCLIGFIISLMFVRTGTGLAALDIVDHFINNFGIAFAGLAEVVVLGWLYKLSGLKEHINSISDFAVGSWWKLCLQVITPIVLGYMAISNFIHEIKVPYGGYSSAGLITLGWLWVIAIVVIGIVLSNTKGKGELLSGTSTKK